MTARAGRPTPRYLLPGLLALLAAAGRILQLSLFRASFCALSDD